MTFLLVTVQQFVVQPLGWLVFMLSRHSKTPCIRLHFDTMLLFPRVKVQVPDVVLYFLGAILLFEPHGKVGAIVCSRMAHPFGGQGKSDCPSLIDIILASPYVENISGHVMVFHAFIPVF